MKKLIALFLAISSMVNAELILDQRTVAVVEDGNPASAVGLVEENREIECAQTITAGISGDLSQIDLWLARQADASVGFVVSILGGGNTPNTQTTLASINVPASSIASTNLRVFSLVSIDTSSYNLYFDAGEVFTVALSAPDEPISTIAPYWTPYTWNTENPGQYAQGLRYSRDLLGGTVWGASGGVDQAVQTWVDPIPEPSTITLLAISGMVIYWGRNRFKNKLFPTRNSSLR